MKLSNPLAVLFGSLAISYGWVLDASCSQYSTMITNAMVSAFEFSQAASDIFGITGPGSGNKWQAQSDLISYLFAETLTNGDIDTSNTNWKTAKNIFSLVQAFNTNEGNPQTTPSSYLTLDSNVIILYCDYTRFTEGVDCNKKAKPGYACDTKINHLEEMDDEYNDCKAEVDVDTDGDDGLQVSLPSNHDQLLPLLLLTPE